MARPFNVMFKGHMHTFCVKVQNAFRGLHKRPSEFCKIYINQWNQARCMGLLYLNCSGSLCPLWLWRLESWSEQQKKGHKVGDVAAAQNLPSVCVCGAGIGAQFNPWELPTLLSLSLGDDGSLPPLPPLYSPTSRISGEKPRDPWARTSIIATWISFRINLIGAHISLGIPFDFK